MTKPLKILVADDEAVIRMDISEMLKDAGHEVVAEAADGKRAIMLARKFRPDIVIMDVSMPQMDGITAAKKIDGERLAPVLLLTAFSEEDVVSRAKESGVLAYLVKPVREENLFPAIEIALSRYNDRLALEAELDDLKDSLETRKLLDRAKGIIIAAHNLTEEESYNRIRSYAMTKRKTIKEIAEAIVRAADKQKK